MAPNLTLHAGWGNVSENQLRRARLDEERGISLECKCFESGDSRIKKRLNPGACCGKLALILVDTSSESNEGVQIREETVYIKHGCGKSTRASRSGLIIGNKKLTQAAQRVTIKVDGIDFHINGRFK
jgi:hypothetical protein